MAKHVILSILVAGLFGAGARAQNVIVNGGFEAGGGSFAGWTVVNQALGSGDWYIQMGAVSPTSGSAVPVAPGPTHAAMTDQGGPGSHMLDQDFAVPATVNSAVLSFERFRGNRGAIFNALPLPLDYTGPTNQQARVDILRTTAGPFSILPADVLLNIWMTTPADPAVDPAYIKQTVNLTSFLAAYGGQTLRLRFAETDNGGFFQLGIDNVVLNINGGPAPNPGDEGTFVGSTGPAGISGTNNGEGTYGYGARNASTASRRGVASRGPVLIGPFLNELGGGYGSRLPGLPSDAMIVFNVSQRQNAVAEEQAGRWTVVALGSIIGTGGILVLLGIAVFLKGSAA